MDYLWISAVWWEFEFGCEAVPNTYENRSLDDPLVGSSIAHRCRSGTSMLLNDSFSVRWGSSVCHLVSYNPINSISHSECVNLYTVREILRVLQLGHWV
jgi:hypothetical protein